jgi:hypothetical protein
MNLQRNMGPIKLHTIHCNPAKPHEFVVGGSEEYSYIYDVRFLHSEHSDGSLPIIPPLQRHCPQSLESMNRYPSVHITASAFSARGELLVQYAEADIYLFHPWLADKLSRVRCCAVSFWMLGLLIILG